MDDDTSTATDSLKLQIALVPKRLWGKNLRSTVGLGKARWDRLRRELIEAHGARCAICGASGKCHGHEVWDYREKRTVGTAVLLRVEMICVDCHDVHHWARTEQLFADGAITPQRYNHLRRHFRRVNGCRQEVFNRHFEQSLQLWKQRSKKRWKIDWGDFAAAVAEAKKAREAWATCNPARNAAGSSSR